MELASLFVAIIAVGISIWAVYKSDDIARKSGAYDKGELILSFDNFDVLENQTYDVYFGINFVPKELNLLELPISVTNVGKKSVEEIALISNYPNIMNAAIDSKLIELKSILGNDISREYFESKPFDQVALKLKQLNPNSAIHMSDLLSVQETSINNHKISAVTKDGKNVDFNVSADIDYKIISTLTAKDITSQNFQFNAQNINSINAQEILKMAIKSKLSSKEKINRPFFIFITEIDKINQSDSIKINQLKIRPNSGSLYKFDDEMKYLLEYNRDGSIRNIFDVKS